MRSLSIKYSTYHGLCRRFGLYREVCSKMAFLVKNVKLATGKNGDAAVELNSIADFSLYVASLDRR